MRRWFEPDRVYFDILIICGPEQDQADPSLRTFTWSVSYSVEYKTCAREDNDDDDNSNKSIKKN